MAPPSNSSPYWLFVEGTDDLCSVVHLLKRHDYDWDREDLVRPFVRCCGGVNTLLDEAMPPAVKTLRRLGIVLDADVDVGARWVQLRNRLGEFGVKLPDAPSPDGVVIDAGGRLERVGVWLMPDNGVPGTLEHFLAKLVPSGDRLWVHAQNATAQAIAIGAPLQRKDVLKGTLHAWLAWQEDPGIPFGTALRAKVFSCDSPEAMLFVQWFRRLYCDPMPHAAASQPAPAA